MDNKFFSASKITLLTLAMSTSFQALSEINISGFGTIGLGTTADKDESLYGYDDDVDFKQDSLFALQVTSDLGDKIGITAQIIARGTDDWDPAFEWAFISYDVSDNWRLLFGRQRAPQKLYSDFVDVGYAYHWISPPSGLYSPSFDSFDGIGSIYNSTLGEFDSTLHLLLGRTADNPFGDAVSKIDISNYYLASYTLSNENYTARMALGQRDVLVTIPGVDGDLAGGLVALGAGLDQALSTGIDYQGLADSIIIDDSTTVLTVALKADYDWGFAVAEWEKNDYGDNFLGETDNWYVSAGIKDDAFVYHITYGASETMVNDLDRLAPISSVLNSIPPAFEAALAPLTVPFGQLVAGANSTLRSQIIDEKYITVGVRWDFHESAALKLEYTDFSDDYVNPYNPEDSSQDASVLRMAISTIF